MQFITKESSVKYYRIHSSSITDWPLIWSEYLSSKPDWVIIDEALQKVAIQVIRYFWPRQPDTTDTKTDQNEKMNVVFAALKRIKPATIQKNFPAPLNINQINSYFFRSGLNALKKDYFALQNILKNEQQFDAKSVNEKEDPQNKIPSNQISHEKQIVLDNEIDDAIEKLKGSKKLKDAIRYKKKSGNSILISDIEEVLRRRAYRNKGTIHISMKDGIPEVLCTMSFTQPRWSKWVYVEDDFEFVIDPDVIPVEISIRSWAEGDQNYINVTVGPDQKLSTVKFEPITHSFS